MEQLRELVLSLIEKQSLIQASLSQVRSKELPYQKVTIKPILLKEEYAYQFSFFTGQKVLHENWSPEETAERMERLLAEEFRQVLLMSKEADYQVLISKKHKVTILKKPPSKQQVAVEHNRKKQYILEEGKPIPFLVELGVMNDQGKVLAKKYDKFRQINRFLEMIADVVPYLPKERTIQIVDFGCGKSYLTFALYYYLKELQGLKLQVTGLDLKEDVITHCNRLSQQFGYEHLRFQVGDIAQFTELEQVDMVVTLHACDTATDAALEKAVRWQAKVILSVPCCQHELYRQVENSSLAPMLKHGIIKERLAALATDAARAQLLTILGYKTQILEFIDLEHTPKNLLIRAVRTDKQKPSNQQVAREMASYQQFTELLQITPYLERALQDKFPTNGEA